MSLPEPPNANDCAGGAGQPSLRCQIDELLAENARLNEITAAISDANAYAATLMAELEDVREVLQHRNKELEEHSRLLAAAVEQGRAADRARAVLANTSHEIRTPLNGIIGMCELALETNLSPDQREYLTTIKGCSDFLLQLVNDVLDVSKLQADRVELSPTAFHIRDSIEEAVRALAVQAHSKGVELICDIDPEVPEYVWGDCGRLHQIVANLVSNAIKFTPEGEVIVRAELNGHPTREGIELHVAVCDTGIGIPQDRQSLIFEPYIQADSSTARIYGGTGLGLMISKKLVNLMGGEIWVYSEPGEGSEFHFTIQLGLPAKSPPGRSAPAMMPGRRALIVDDSAANRRVLATVFGRLGLRVTATDGAPAALAAANEAASLGRTFDFAIIDLCIPGTDGLELLGRLKQVASCAHARSVILGAAPVRMNDADPGVVVPDARVMKPVKHSDLLTLMARLSQDEPHLPRRQAVRDVNANSLKILVAEDNPVNQTIFSRVLARHGYEVQLASHGREAIELHASGHFDLVLMDIQMPEMTGLEAAAAIRQRESTTGAHTPIVALTADSSESSRSACAAAGMDGFLLKPINSAKLLEGVAAAIAGHTVHHSI